jgi:flagellar biosynthesis/type III secretory pathway M-ring protein FliF/YscJ
MDWLNKFWTSTAAWLRQLSPAARAGAGASLVLLLAGVAYLVTHESSTHDALLLGGQDFSASEMAAMEAAFGKANLSGYHIEGNRLRVDRGRQAAYMAALADHGALPAHFGDFLTAATVSVGPFTSRAQQEEIIKNARQKELALIICAMQGIEKAAVHYDTQKKSGLRSTTLTTASVSVKPLGSQPLAEEQVPMIRHLVAGAIAGLSPEAVTVVDLNGRTYGGASFGGGSTTNSSAIGAAYDDPYLSRVKQYQTMYEATIRNALSYVPGATISVHVELDRELVHRTEKETNASARERTQVDLAALTPKRVTASIGMPSSYFENLWQHRNDSAGGSDASQTFAQAERAETEKIREHVARLLPQSASTSDTGALLVTVTTFSHVPSGEMLSQPSTHDESPWLANPWQLAIGALAVYLGYRVLRRRPASIPSRPSATPSNTRVDAAIDDAPPPHAGRRAPTTAATLREELAEMVRDNPEASANVLREWIGHAS